MKCCITVVKLVNEYLLWIEANVDVRRSIMRVAYTTSDDILSNVNPDTNHSANPTNPNGNSKQ